MSTRYNLLAPDVRADPYPVYAEMRRAHPVCQVDPGGLWAVTRHDDVVAVLGNPRLFSSVGFGRVLKPAWLGHNPFADSILGMDPPGHTRLRALIENAFGPPALARMERRIRTSAETLAARLSTQEPVDFIEHFSSPFTASLIGHLLGLEISLQPRFTRWADDLTTITGTAPNDSVRQAQIRDSVAELEQYLAEILAHRRQEPCDDLVTDLVRTRVGGESLTEAELRSFLFLLLVAGQETTVHLVNHTVRLMVELPGMQERLRADKSLLPRFVEEVLRYETPVHCISRDTTADTELAGVRLPKGARLFVVLASAARDETRFPGADRFDLDRGGLHTLAFGHGIHACMGSNLARLGARIGLEVLLKRFAWVSRDAQPLVWNRSMTVRGPVALPLRFQPA